MRRGGTLFISDNEVFYNEADNRNGCSVDVLLLAELFHNFLQCEVVNALDRPANQMIVAINKFAIDPKRADDDFIIATLGSHGSNGEIDGVDGIPVKIGSIIEAFSDAKVPHLKGKPRLIFVEACRAER